MYKFRFKLNKEMSYMDIVEEVRKQYPWGQEVTEVCVCGWYSIVPTETKSLVVYTVCNHHSK